MRGVTSVGISKEVSAKTGGLSLGAAGLLVLLYAFFSVKAHNWHDGLGILTFAALLFIIGFLRWRATPPTRYLVKLTSASGEAAVYSSTDEKLAREIVNQLNEAVATR